MNRAGLPATIAYGGTSFVTTASRPHAVACRSSRSCRGSRSRRSSGPNALRGTPSRRSCSTPRPRSARARRTRPASGCSTTTGASVRPRRKKKSRSAWDGTWPRSVSRRVRRRGPRARPQDADSSGAPRSHPPGLLLSSVQPTADRNTGDVTQRNYGAYVLAWDPSWLERTLLDVVRRVGHPFARRLRPCLARTTHG